jgi:Arc/MetJ-type ribon-helix-helix transcriptional regulator
MIELHTNRKARFWHVPVTEALDRAVEEAIRRDMHSTKADLIREAVREKLKEIRASYGVFPANGEAKDE